MATRVVCMLSNTSHALRGVRSKDTCPFRAPINFTCSRVDLCTLLGMEQNAMETTAFGPGLCHSARSLVSAKDISINATHDAEAAHNTSTTDAFISNRNTFLRGITFFTPTGSYPMKFSRHDCHDFFCFLESNWGHEEPHLGLRLGNDNYLRGHPIYEGGVVCDAHHTNMIQKLLALAYEQLDMI
eukprot:6204147-Pleurochrysis_carterae.AAC.4